MLIFTNNRRLTERVRTIWASAWARSTSPRTTEAWHASCAFRLKSGSKRSAKIMVATACSELGLDIGSIRPGVQLAAPGRSR